MMVSPPSSVTKLPIRVSDPTFTIQKVLILMTVVLRHGAERMSSMKVLFALGLVLESLGLDVGISRLLLTFLMQ